MTARIFLTCWLLLTLHWAPWIVREHFPAITLASDASLNVARFRHYTIDIFPLSDGRAFINNNPGASFLAAIPIALFNPLLHRIQPQGLPTPIPASDDSVLRAAIQDHTLPYLLAAAFVAFAFLSAPLTALAAALLYRRLAQDIPQRHALLAALSYAFATPLFFRTAYLNHNLIVCHFTLFAFLLIYNRPLSPPRLLAAGLLSGYTLFCDFTGAITIFALAAFLLRCGPRPAALFCAAALPGALALLAVQWSAFGNPLLPSQHYMPAIDVTSRGYRGFTWPSPALIQALLFRPTYGLFAWCPLLALAFAAPFLKRVPYRVPRYLQLLVFGFFTASLLFSAANQYTWLQWNTGLRYLVPVIPGLLLLSLQTLQNLPKPLAAIFLLSSLFMSWSVASTWRLHAFDAAAQFLRHGPTLPWLTVFRRWHWLPDHHWTAFLPVFAVAILIAALWLPTLRRTPSRNP